MMFNKRVKTEHMKNLFVVAMMSISLSLISQEKELRTFYDDGSVKSEYVYSNADNYKVTNFYLNGKIMEIGEFTNGKMNGTWVSFNENGAKTGEAVYNQGKKQGEWKMYDSSGNIRFAINYDNGKMVSATSFDSSGKLVAETHSR